MLRALTLLVPGAILLAGCGGGGGSDGGGKTLTVPAGNTVGVSADEYEFSPARIVVGRGGSGPIEIKLANDGAAPHNLRVEKGGQEVGGTSTLGGGQSDTASVSLQPGKYQFICSVGNHAALGMKGTLEVR